LSWHSSSNTEEKSTNDGVILGVNNHLGGFFMKTSLLHMSFVLSFLAPTFHASAQSLELAVGQDDNQVIGSIVRSNYELQTFARDEQDAIMWQQRYAAAPSGSWDETYARDQRDQSIQRALNVINSPYAFQGLMTSQIENFAEEMNRKYSAAPSGSALERMYIQARQAAYTAFKSSLLQDVQNLSYDWRQLHDLALRMDQAYAAAPSGSQKEAAYNEARRLAYQNLQPSVEQELPRYRDFRQIEQLAIFFDGLYVQAPSGSLKEGVYRQIELRAFNEAVSRANYELPRYPQQHLFQIQDEYHQKYSAASSGSTKENYYRQIRDIARSLLGYRP